MFAGELSRAEALAGLERAARRAGLTNPRAFLAEHLGWGIRHALLGIPPVSHG